MSDGRKLNFAPLDDTVAADWGTALSDALAASLDGDTITLPERVEITAQDLTCNKSIRFFGNRSKITVGAVDYDYAIEFSGADVEVHDLIVDLNEQNPGALDGRGIGYTLGTGTYLCQGCTVLNGYEKSSNNLFYSKALDTKFVNCYGENPGYSIFRIQAAQDLSSTVLENCSGTITRDTDPDSIIDYNRWITYEGQEYGS